MRVSRPAYTLIQVTPCQLTLIQLTFSQLTCCRTLHPHPEEPDAGGRLEGWPRASWFEPAQVRPPPTRFSPPAFPSHPACFLSAASPFRAPPPAPTLRSPPQAG